MSLPLLLVDASVWIDYFRSVKTLETDFLYDALTRYEVCLCDVTLMEVLQGVKDDVQHRKIKKELDRFHIIETGGRDNCVRASDNFRALRKHGITVRSSIDCILATTAIDLEIPVLARDRDFTHFARHLGLELLPDK